MVQVKKTVSILLTLCMIMQCISISALAYGESISNFEVALAEWGGNVFPGENILIENVDELTTDENILFSMLYNSTYYDGFGELRENPVVEYINLDNFEVFEFEQSSSPLKCIKEDHWTNSGHVDGIYSIEFQIPETLPRGDYKVIIKLKLPEGKEQPLSVLPIHYIIDKINVITAQGGGGEVVEPEENIFETVLPDSTGVQGEITIVEDLKTLIPEDMHFGLMYISESYEEYIENDAVYIFETVTDKYTHYVTPSTVKHSGEDYNLLIPVPDELSNGTYKLTIELDIAEHKEADSVKPYRFIIEKFVVDNGTLPDDGEGDEEQPEITNAIFNVMDTTNLSPVSGAEIFITNEDGTVNKKAVSNIDGIAEIAIENGIYNVQVIANDYEMRSFVIEKTDEQYEFTPYLNKNSLLKIETNVKEMTREEMVEAGIDVNAAENKHIYKCVAVLKFIPVISSGSSEINPTEIEFDYVCDETGTIIKAEPAHCDGKVIYPVSKDIYLIIHSEVTWLKEMFDVQLVVANTSAVETIKDITATLNLPEGLSLAVMTDSQQTANISISEIEPLESSDIHWYVCGDKAGEYLINGNVTGNRIGGGITEPIKAAFVMQNPITVLAGDAMKLLIEAEKYATVGEEYKVRYTLQNVSGKKLYDVALNVLGGKFCKAYSVEELIHNGELVDTENLSGTFNNGVELKTEAFEPGDILTGVFEIIFGTGIDTDHIRYMVSEMFTFTGEGSTTTIPTEIVLVDSVIEHNYDEGEITVPSSCTVTGKKVFVCQDEGCGETYEAVIPKVDHEYGNDWITETESTCVVKGKQYKKCKNCDFKVYADLLEGAHKWNDGVITTPSTETTEGVKTYSCANCEETWNEMLPKLVKQDLYFVTGETMVRTYNGAGEIIYNKADNDSVDGGAITYTSSNEDVATVGENGKVAIFNAGETTITATAAATDKYAETTASYTLTVNKAPLTVKVNDINVFYGEEPRDYSYTATGFVGDDSYEVILGEAVYLTQLIPSDYEGDYTQDNLLQRPVGEYAVNIIEGLEAKNYDITIQSGILTVNKAKEYTIELSGLNKKFGDETKVVANIVPSDKSAEIKIEYLLENGEWVCEEPSGAGEYSVRASLVDSKNIVADATKYTNAVLVIKPAATIGTPAGDAIGVETIERENEIEFVIPDEIVSTVVGSIPDNGELVIDSGLSENKVNNFVIPANVIKAINESETAEKITVLTDASEITMDSDIVNTIAEKMLINSKMRINVEVVDSHNLTPQQQAAIDAISVDATVLELNLDILHHDEFGNVTSVESVHELNGNADIRTAITLPENMLNKRIVVCYVSDDGSTTYLKCEYADGFVSFKTDHFSHYVIAVTECTHEWNQGEITKPATSTQTGIKKITCTVCSATKEEPIPVVHGGGSSTGGIVAGGGGSVSGSGGGGMSATVQTDKTVTNEEAEPKTDEKTEWINSFSDINTDDWYFEAVKYVVENNIMKGTSNSEFNPEGELTRAMFVTILYRMENEPEASGEQFADVKADSWYAKAVAWASENGLVNGVDKYVFAPENNITREQMATMIYRYAKFKGYEVEVEDKIDFKDAADISDFADEAIRWANSMSIMNGNADNTFAPADSTTRAQAAAVVMRVIENLK